MASFNNSVCDFMMEETARPCEVNQLTRLNPRGELLHVRHGSVMFCDMFLTDRYVAIRG